MFDLTASGSLSLTSEPDDGTSLDHPMGAGLPAATPTPPSAGVRVETHGCGSRPIRGRLARLRRAILQDPDAFIASRLDPAISRLADEAELFR